MAESTNISIQLDSRSGYYQKYMAIGDVLTVMLPLPGFDESEEYDNFLDESDLYWREMTPDEQMRVEYYNLRYNVCLDPEECWIGIDGWE